MTIDDFKAFLFWTSMSIHKVGILLLDLPPLVALCIVSQERHNAARIPY